MKNIINESSRKKLGYLALAILVTGMMLAPALTTQHAYAANTLTVRAYTTSGDVLSMYTVIKSGSTTVKSGFTPLTYAGTTDKTYTVEVHNYKDLTFSKWGNDSTGNPRTVNLSGDITAVAYYNKGTTSTSTSTSITSTTTSSKSSLIPKTGVMVALYMYPGSTGSAHWQKVIDEKKEHPSVPIVAIFNPSSGPGSSKDSNIAYWVDKLKNAGVLAIGYIPDGYADTMKPGTRTMTYMKDSISKYRNWYDADGVYFDQMTNKAGHESRYRDLTSYAKSLGMKLTGSNPGTDVPPSYIGTIDVIKTSEGKGYISSTDPNIIGSSWVKGGYTGWHEDYDKRNFSVVRYDVSWLDKNWVNDVSEHMGLMYITNGNDGNGRWLHISPYFGDLVATLDK